MAGGALGYEFLRERLETAAFPTSVARLAPVTKVTVLDEHIAVPAGVAPDSEDPLRHLLFAFKHEGMNMQAAILALKKIPDRDLAQAFLAAPSSAYVRTACYLWELANRRDLEGLPAVKGPYAKLFDERHYLTDRPQRNTRWRVDFNGIGSPHYCITVRRTPAIQRLLDQDILGQTAKFVQSMDPKVLDRAIQWAYLRETDNSFAIEKEKPTQGKAEAFAALLAKAGDREPITEDYLAALQRLAVSNPLDQAFEFRSQQNRLRNDLPGAMGVTYLPPPPERVVSLMAEVMSLGNRSESTLDPLVRASLLSFAFVFAHPFMDGNGRLSRFLFHKAACADKRLASGMVLPVSVAMKRHEGEYLAALQSFSKPARERWTVEYFTEDDIQTRLDSDADFYNYWDGTSCAEFGLQMAQEALRHDLVQEINYLRRYDVVYRAVNAAVDLNNEDMVLLVRSIVANEGVLSRNRQKKLIAKGHPAELIEAAVDAGNQALENLGEERPEPPTQAEHIG